MQHAGIKELLETSWNRELDTKAALHKLQDVLKKWNKEVFGDIQSRKDKMMKDIKVLQEEIDRNPNEELLWKEEELLREFDVIFEQEDMFWFQKSREKWVVYGDRNSKFFHTSNVIRRRRNRIDTLKNEEGRWISDTQELEGLAVQYYTRLYSLDDVDSVSERFPWGRFARLTGEDQRELNRHFTALEVESAVRSICAFKAPGPDGFQPIFYHKNWDVVGGIF